MEAEGIPKPEFDRGFLKPFGEEMQFLKPDQVRGLYPENLVKYIAEKDKNVRGLVIAFREAAQNYKKNITPETRSRYEVTWKNTREAAERLVSKESLTPDTLLKLTEKQYVERAALFDKNVYQNNLKRETLEELIRSDTDVLYKKLAEKFIAREGEPALNAEIERLALGLENKADSQSKPTDDFTIAARKDFLKNQANFYASDPELKFYKAEIEAREMAANRAMKEALKGADKVFKRNKILKSSGKNRPLS